MLMSLGLFVWSLNTLSYQDLKRVTEWRHPGNSRIGKRPSSQYIGQGDDKITLSGWLAPDIAGDVLSLDEIRMMADKGEPYAMVSGDGQAHGLWVIERLSEDKTLFYPNGAARRIEFSLGLKRVDDSQIDQVTLITDPTEVFV